jgi:hypothetical protein
VIHGLTPNNKNKKNGLLIINESPNQSVEQTDWTFAVFREGCGRGCLTQQLDSLGNLQLISTS